MQSPDCKGNNYNTLSFLFTNVVRKATKRLQLQSGEWNLSIPLKSCLGFVLPWRGTLSCPQNAMKKILELRIIAKTEVYALSNLGTFCILYLSSVLNIQQCKQVVCACKSVKHSVSACQLCSRFGLGRSVRGQLKQNELSCKISVFCNWSLPAYQAAGLS